MNRNERAVGLLTEGGSEKIDFMRNIFNKYKKIEVEIGDLQTAESEGTVSAVLKFERLSLPDGTTTYPSSSWRDHPIRVEYNTEGFTKIQW